MRQRGAHHRHAIRLYAAASAHGRSRLSSS
jgi:hypothetical protein